MVSSHLDVCPHRLELCHLCGLYIQFWSESGEIWLKLQKSEVSFCFLHGWTSDLEDEEFDDHSFRAVIFLEVWMVASHDILFSSILPVCKMFEKQEHKNVNSKITTTATAAASVKKEEKKRKKTKTKKKRRKERKKEKEQIEPKWESTSTALTRSSSSTLPQREKWIYIKWHQNEIQYSLQYRSCVIPSKNDFHGLLKKSTSFSALVLLKK